MTLVPAGECGDAAAGFVRGALRGGIFDRNAEMMKAVTAGHMSIELIQPEDQHPSVYKELIDRAICTMPGGCPKPKVFI